MIELKSIFVLFVLISITSAGIISINDQNWYFTEWNWYKDPSGEFAQSANPGSYFKLTWTSSSFIYLMINSSASPNIPFTKLQWSIDQLPFQEVFLLNGTSNDLIILADGLNSTQTHTIILYIKSSLQSQDRWLYGPADRVRIQGMQVEDGATTLPSILRPKRLLVYWDSIGEGVNVLTTSKGDLIDNDAISTWTMDLAIGLNAEISVVAFGRLGWTVVGNGNVPIFANSNSETAQSWNMFDVEHVRFFPSSGLNNQPDYIFCGHGTNDAGAPDQEVISAAFAWFNYIRQACPKSSIFSVIPFGQFKENALEIAFNTYQSKTPDSNAFQLNLGEEGAEGLSQWGASIYSNDGIHPLWFRSGQLGSLLTSTALSALSNSSHLKYGSIQFN